MDTIAMLNIRKAEERGRSKLEWLDSYHTFSFADYYDPQHMAFGPLRVINDDRIAPGRGFGTHPHRDMEIITYVIEGSLEHRDSMGNGSVMRPGDVQRMSAGTGVTHSEFNHSQDEPVHLLQIWILPDARGHQPGYEQVFFGADQKRGRLTLVASGQGREGSVSLNQDADLYAALIDGDERMDFAVREGRFAWLQVARGVVEVNGQRLEHGDGASLAGPATLGIGAGQDAEILLFDLAHDA